MKLFRIENEETNHGMWYREDGTFDPFIYKLTEGISKDLPMGFEERYSDGGMRWFSGCGSIEQMHHWFSNKDAFELILNGYSLYEFEVIQANPEEHQVLFTREGVVNKREIALDTIWDVSGLNKESIAVR